MAIRSNRFGLSSEEIESIIDAELDANADLLIGIDDPEVKEMIDVLKKAIATAIAINNKKIAEDIEG